MKKTVEEFVEHYDDWADEYDSENDNELIRTSMSLVVEHAAPTLMTLWWISGPGRERSR